MALATDKRRNGNQTHRPALVTGPLIIDKLCQMIEFELNRLQLLRQVLTLIVCLRRLKGIFFLTHHFQYRANHHIQEYVCSTQCA